MTSAQTMLALVSPARSAVLALALVLGMGPGCESIRKRDKLTPATVIRAPYDVARGDVLWGVAPLANESGTELVDPLAISDKLVAAAEEVEGIRTVPLNRTLMTMRAIGMTSVQTPTDVRQLATAMGVDGLIVGTVTAYDPYDPPTLGLSLALFARTGAMHLAAPLEEIDPRALAASPTDSIAPRAAAGDGPAAVVSANLDARDHNVLMALRDYAAGRHDPVSALGWRRFTASMDLYTQFAAQHMVAALVAKERERLAPPLTVAEEPPTP